MKDKHIKFCNEYVLDLNATNAAIRAGYNKDRARITASELMNRDDVQDMIQKLKSKAVEKLDITHTDLLIELKNWAYSDITETISLTPSEVKELPIEIRRLVTKYKHTKTNIEGVETEVIELHFVSKEKAIEMIAKHIGFYEIDNQQKKIEIPLFPDVYKDNSDK